MPMYYLQFSFNQAFENYLEVTDVKKVLYYTQVNFTQYVGVSFNCKEFTAQK